MKFPQNLYFLLRHGETPYQLKKEKIHYPWPESSPILLTERGKKQIEILAKKLKQENFDLIFLIAFPKTSNLPNYGKRAGTESKL